MGFYSRCEEIFKLLELARYIDSNTKDAQMALMRGFHAEGLYCRRYINSDTENAQMALMLGFHAKGSYYQMNVDSVTENAQMALTRNLNTGASMMVGSCLVCKYHKCGIAIFLQTLYFFIIISGFDQ